MQRNAMHERGAPAAVLATGGDGERADARVVCVRVIERQAQRLRARIRRDLVEAHALVVPATRDETNEMQ